ncbi:MAG TPA: amine oxidase [Candidatus Limnocylindria bacterium]|nr:amine oxidase [Candidatus Limnocylindria bacterium]
MMDIAKKPRPGEARGSEAHGPGGHDAPFRSFWMAGFECCDHVNACGQRVDLLETTGHLGDLDADFARLKAFGMLTVREGIRWSKVETAPYRYDWGEVRRIDAAARRHGIQVIWDICHFGYADDLHSPLHPEFVGRFAALCEAFALLLRELDPDGRPAVVPINEVSFVAWMACRANASGQYVIAQGWESKYRLMQAFIQGVKRMKQVLPGLLVMITEPLVSIVPASDDPAEAEAAREVYGHQFQAVDILLGRICPELGGGPELLDVIGYNYYYDNQREYGTERVLDWHPHAHEPRRLPLHRLLADAYERYGKPLIISETSHPLEERPQWMDMIGGETAEAIRRGLPLLGVCIYPVIDRPDWDFLDRWHHSGLWDNCIPQQEGPAADAPAGEAVPDAPAPARVLHEPFAASLRRAQALVAETLAESSARGSGIRGVIRGAGAASSE